MCDELKGSLTIQKHPQLLNLVCSYKFIIIEIRNHSLIHGHHPLTHTPSILAGTHLVVQDPETGKAGEFAFDNPAFKTDGTKAQNSPLDTKWMGGGGGGAKENGNRATLTNEKRKSQDDNAVTSNNVAQPRVIGLRGSDFTGLGIELCGGLKEGIYVRKVMPQGPASGHVNVGDKITSITIDFNHLVLEDAVSILSYAAPYSVQLELVDAKANVAAMSHANSPKSNTSTLSHPLYRSGSQSDVNTVSDENVNRLPIRDRQLHIPILLLASFLTPD